MKIFDFTNGEKGKFLGESTCSGLGGWWLQGKRINGDSVQVGRYTYHESLYSKGLTKVLPQDFGVEAICFCRVDKDHNGDNVYNWYYVCTKRFLDANIDWKYDDSANQANKQGMIDELMEGIAFEEDFHIDRALSRYASMSYEQVKEEWMEICKST